MRHGSSREAKQHFINALERRARGKWVAVIANIEDGELKLLRTTFEFPKERFGEVVGLLAGNLIDEVGRPDEIEPLPVAPVLLNRLRPPTPVLPEEPQVENVDMTITEDDGEPE